MESKRRLMVSVCYPLLLGAICLLAGCQTPMSDQELNSPTVFTATINGDEPATRTLLGNAASTTDPRDVLWKEGDELIVGGATYKLSSGANTTTATLTPKVASQLAQKDPVTGKYEAYYPTLIYNGGTPTLRDTQTYEAPETVEGTPFVVASHLPMYAQSETTELSFKNLCAVLNFKLTGTDKVTKVVVTSATQNLSGPFDVVETTSGAGDWYAKIKDSDPAASNQVTLDCTGGVSGGSVPLDATTPTEFCIALPPATYDQNDLTVEVYGYKGTGTTEELLMPAFKNSAAAGSQLERSKIYDIKKSTKAAVFSVTFDETSPYTTFDAATKTISLANPGFSASNPLRFSVETNLGFTVDVEGSPGSGTASPPNGNESSSPTTTPVTATISGYIGVSDATSSAPTLTNYQPFSVGGGKQIYFSPGNLQYQASTGIWRFAQHQWDFVGGSSSNDAGTVYEGGVRSHNLTSYTYVNNVCTRSQYSGWIDLFGWGTTGINYRNFQPFPSYVPSNKPAPDEYQPWTAETGNVSYYGPVSGDLSGDSDWGVNMGNGYRTPTPEELEYIMDRVNTNPDNCCYMHAWFHPGSWTFKITFTAKEDLSYTEQFTVIQSSYPVYMVVLFPDGISKTSSLVSAHSSHINNNQTRKELTLDQLLELQNAGCVILPATGRRSGASTLLEPWYSIYYWTNKAGTYPYSAVVANLSLTSTYQFYRSGGDRFYGRPVRLVKDVTP